MVPFQAIQVSVFLSGSPMRAEWCCGASARTLVLVIALVRMAGAVGRSPWVGDAVASLGNMARRRGGSRGKLTALQSRRSRRVYEHPVVKKPPCIRGVIRSDFPMPRTQERVKTRLDRDDLK